jgi:chromate reductase
VESRPSATRSGSWPSCSWQISIYDAWCEVPIYDEGLDGAKPHQAVARLRDALRAAGDVFFATPEYNSSVPGGLKNAIDWKILAAAGARVIDGEVALGHAMDRFDENGRLNDENLEDEVREVVRTLLAEAGSGVPVGAVA